MKLSSSKVTALVAGILSISASATLNADTAVSIEYGRVIGEQTIPLESKEAGGAILGGLIGGLTGHHNQGARALVGALAGGTVEHFATSGKTVEQYTVRLNNGGEVRISTEQRDIRRFDCVMVEQGAHANIRRVSSVHCEQDSKPAAHHVSAANDCAVAKKELADANTNDAINQAIRKVRVLCED